MLMVLLLFRRLRLRFLLSYLQLVAVVLSFLRYLSAKHMPKWEPQLELADTVGIVLL
jgi:hypothetical protein